ncbi:hypothetical protein MTO96_003593 [Rhipicephalus appendiculatus]
MRLLLLFYLNPAVQLLAKSSYFRGFLVKALDKQGEDIGRFLEGPNYKPMETCSGATHESNNNKRDVEFLWKAPADKSGSVRFNSSSPNPTPFGQAPEAMDSALSKHTDTAAHLAPLEARLGSLESQMASIVTTIEDRLAAAL